MAGAIGNAKGATLNSASREELKRIGGLGHERVERVVPSRPFDSWDRSEAGRGLQRHPGERPWGKPALRLAAGIRLDVTRSTRDRVTAVVRALWNSRCSMKFDIGDSRIKSGGLARATDLLRAPPSPL